MAARLMFKTILMLLPWKVKRYALIYFFNYKLHPNSSIGFSWIFPSHLEMEAHAKIGHFNVAIHLDTIFMGEYSSIARSNWITGFATKSGSKHFAYEVNRASQLIIGKHSAITKNHHIDCTSSITIGKFTTVAGYYSQLLSHSINIFENKQESNPIEIGDYCFVGTNSIILGGSKLPNYSVLGAKSLLNKEQKETFSLYGGVPAIRIKAIAPNAKYFLRDKGFVY